MFKPLIKLWSNWLKWLANVLLLSNLAFIRLNVFGVKYLTFNSETSLSSLISESNQSMNQSYSHVFNTSHIVHQVLNECLLIQRVHKCLQMYWMSHWMHWSHHLFANNPRVSQSFEHCLQNSDIIVINVLIILLLIILQLIAFHVKSVENVSIMWCIDWLIEQNIALIVIKSKWVSKQCIQ